MVKVGDLIERVPEKMDKNEVDATTSSPLPLTNYYIPTLNFIEIILRRHISGVYISISLYDLLFFLNAFWKIYARQCSSNTLVGLTN